MRAQDFIPLSIRKMSPNSSLSSFDTSIPFSFPSNPMSKLKPKIKSSLNLSVDRRPPQIDTQLVSPKTHTSFIVTPKEIPEKMPINVRPHTTKFSQKHFNLERRRKRSWEDMKLPVNPSTVIKQFSHRLQEWEKEEIIKYTNIYYIGKSVRPPIKDFDDEDRDYKIYVGDHINFRYEIISQLGKGSYGQVIEVYDHATRQTLAMKIIKNHKDFHEQAQIEIDILKFLKDNDRDHSSNIVHLEEIFAFRNHIVKYI